MGAFFPHRRNGILVRRNTVMLALIISIIVFLCFFLFLGYDSRRHNWHFQWRQIASLGAYVILLFAAFTSISANEVGIVYDPFKGGIQNETLGEGFHVKSIFQKITKISTTNRTAEISIYGQTKDSIYAEFVITIVYKLESANAGVFYKATGNSDISDSQLNSVVKEALQSASIQYDVYAILGSGLEDCRLEFVHNLSELMNTRYSLTVVSASFDDIDAGDQIESIIQQKAEAIQQVEIAEQERAKAEVEAQTAIIRAENAAEVALIAAEANAEAQIILNSVTVNAINTMYLSQFQEGEDTATPAVYGYLTIQEISTIIIKQLYYDTWNGVLPTIITNPDGIIVNP